MEPVSITISAVLSLAGVVADHLNRLSVEGAIKGTGGGLLLGQLLSTAYLASKIAEVDRHLGEVTATIGQLQATTAQNQRLLIAAAIAPVRNGVEKLEELRVDPQSSSQSELVAVVGLIEEGSAQIRQALDAFSGSELLEQPEVFVSLLSGLSTAAACEILVKAGLGHSPGRLAEATRRYARAFASLAQKLQGLQRFDIVLPSPAMFSAARRLGMAKPVDLRRQFIRALEATESQFLLEASKIALLPG